MNKMMTILAIRRRAIAQIIKKEVDYYVKWALTKEWEIIRNCATCGRTFFPKMRWHFFCCIECRKEFYRGQFKPRD